MLYLDLFGEFPSGPTEVSFLFYSSFNVTILNDTNGSGDGAGSWKTYPEQSNYNLPGTTVQYLFNLSTSSPEYIKDKDTSFTGATATLKLAGLPFNYQTGEYTYYFPFDSNSGLYNINDGNFYLCAPTGYAITSTNENYVSAPGECPANQLSYQYKLNQSLIWIANMANAAIQNLQINAQTTYSKNQTYGLFSLGLGVLLVVSSIVSLKSREESKVDQLMKTVKELREEQKKELTAVHNELQELRKADEEIHDEEE